MVATLETMQDKVLIGRDIGPVFIDLFMQELVENGKETNDGGCVSEVEKFDGSINGTENGGMHVEEYGNEGKVLITRSKVRVEAEEQRKVDKVVKDEGAMSKCTVQLVDKPVQTHKYESQHTDDICSSNIEGSVHTIGSNKGLELPLPIASDEKDGVKLREEILHDKSFEKIWKWADKKENGYFWRDSLVKHIEEGGAGEMLERLVVPSSRRKFILKLAHTIPMAGHMSDKKTKALLRRYYTWPGISKDVVEWCRTCPKCQVVNKTPQQWVPLQLMPIISEPYEVLAFDIVGPFERSTQGYKYVLTAMCSASKYPEAIPVKDIQAENIAEGMLEMFSRTGIPKKKYYQTKDSNLWEI